MNARALFIPGVVAVLPLAFGGLSAGPARAEENCLSAPNTQPLQGSHWYYRTDPVKGSKCWYLRTEGQAIPRQTAEDQLGPEPLELRPVRAAPAAASGDRVTTGSVQHSIQASHKPAASKAVWPDPPVPARADKVAWPDPPAPARADKVAWPDPPAPASTDKVAWPDLPSPAGDVAPEAVAESAPEEKAKQTQEVPASAAKSNKNARNDAGVDRQVAAPTQTADPQSVMPVGMLLALAIGLLITGMIVRRIVRMAFLRQRAVPPERREPVWTTSIPSKRAITNVAAQHRDLAPGSLDNDCLDDDVKQALRKLLRVLDQQAV